MILAADGGGGSAPQKKTKVLGASSRRPAPTRQIGGDRDTRSDDVTVRNTRRATKMPEAESLNLRAMAWREAIAKTPVMPRLKQKKLMMTQKDFMKLPETKRKELQEQGRKKPKKTAFEKSYEAIQNRLATT